MDIFVARQPIFTAKQTIFGYELLFRQGLENSFPGIDGDQATSRVLSNTFFSFHINDILGNHPGFINFTRDLLVRRTPLLFPREHVIVEVLEDIQPDPDVIQALQAIRAGGFRIALDDFVYEKKFDGMIQLCDIIKFDLMATPLETLAPVLTSKAVKDRPITLLAEKVETHEEFKQAKEMGFGLFQGYFFSKPEVLTKKEISANQATRLKLVGEINKRDVDTQHIEGLIKTDVAISFKLLKFINSAYFKRPTPINTIKDAIMFLGTEELKKFITVVVISDLNPDKPSELLRTSLIRARICELCSTQIKSRFSTEELFTIGMFSRMDAIMDMPMKDILDGITLSDRVKDALLDKDSQFRQLNILVTCYEHGDWNHKIFTLLKGNRLLDQLPKFYLDALQMANAFFDQSSPT